MVDAGAEAVPELRVVSVMANDPPTRALEGGLPMLNTDRSGVGVGSSSMVSLTVVTRPALLRSWIATVLMPGVLGRVTVFWVA